MEIIFLSGAGTALVGYRILARATALGSLGLSPGDKELFGPLGPALLTLGVRSLLLSWQRNALRRVGMRGVLPLTSLAVMIWGGHSDLHGLAVTRLGGC